MQQSSSNMKMQNETINKIDKLGQHTSTASTPPLDEIDPFAQSDLNTGASDLSNFLDLASTFSNQGTTLAGGNNKTKSYGGSRNRARTDKVI